MEPCPRYLVSACIVDITKESRIIQITSGLGDEPWQIELFNGVAETMTLKQAAGYISQSPYF
jgi:hypothetical protein